MPTKKKEEVPVMNSNVNNNTNNINVNVHVKKPRSTRKATPKKTSKPNWILKAIVIGLIGLAISLLGKYLIGHPDKGINRLPDLPVTKPAIRKNE